ncbi:MAG: phage replisome organizer N-terminal domain-containing protein [Solobacterium sp.]|nr:phage replisome organizer N-terminal domain-containing protein [Solobacterium sp.]
MATGKKFYWIKLRTSFLDSEKIDFLLSQKNGANYVVIYQMLCLKTINTGGELATQIGEVLIPFDAAKIQRDFKHFDIDTIRVALELFKKLGLIYEQENGIIKIADFDELIGSETDYAAQKRKQRIQTTQVVENTQLLEQKNDIDNQVDNVEDIKEDIRVDSKVDSTVENVHIEIRDKSIEYRDIYRENIIYLLSSSKSIYSNLKLVKQYEETLMMMIKAAQVTKKIPKQGRLEDLMKEIIFDRQDVCNKQGYLIECFKHEEDLEPLTRTKNKEVKNE